VGFRDYVDSAYVTK